MKIDENLGNIFNIDVNISSNVEEIIENDIDKDILGDDDKPDFDKDFKFARNCIVKTMIFNEGIINNMSNIAEASEHPRAYEVVGQLMKSQSDLAKELLELYKKEKHVKQVKVTKDDKNEKEIVPLIENQQNNILFSGSTSELLKTLIALKEK